MGPVPGVPVTISTPPAIAAAWGFGFLPPTNKVLFSDGCVKLLCRCSTTFAVCSAKSLVGSRMRAVGDLLLVDEFCSCAAPTPGPSSSSISVNLARCGVHFTRPESGLVDLASRNHFWCLGVSPLIQRYWLEEHTWTGESGNSGDLKIWRLAGNCQSP